MYLNQNMREFIFCRYCPPIVFYPQIWMTKMNSKLRAIPWEFWDEVFSLSMPSVCPHLTTVGLLLLPTSVHSSGLVSRIGHFQTEKSRSNLLKRRDSQNPKTCKKNELENSGLGQAGFHLIGFQVSQVTPGNNPKNSGQVGFRVFSGFCAL